jgi:peptidoglycan/xylan/chitin deacetylase (PgdA/CDA1 family)
MQIDRLTTLRVARPLLQTGLMAAAPGIPILMYHSVSESVEDGVAPYYRVTTSPARFARQLEWLREWGYTVVPLDEAIGGLAAGKLGRERCVVLTFDDGFRDFLTGAWPAIQRMAATATVFLPTSYISENRRTFKGRECLTWSEVRNLRSCGITFGSHTDSHPKLHDLDWTAVRRELSRSKAKLEGELHQPVSHFAYPYAFPQEDRAFARKLRQELAAQGYESAVTTMIGRMGIGADPLALRRIPVNECDDGPLLRAKLAGAYDWMGDVQLLVRRAKRWTTGFKPS